MGKIIRGFKIGKKLVRVTKWVFGRIRRRTGYNRLTLPNWKTKVLKKLINLGQSLKTGAKSICWGGIGRPGSGYVLMGRDPDVDVPKGHLAVYVGQKDGDFHRVLIPVIYINHPLFGELLKEAEEEFGFNQQGGITIPCPFSEFETVQNRIAAATCFGFCSSHKILWRPSQSSRSFVD